MRSWGLGIPHTTFGGHKAAHSRHPEGEAWVLGLPFQGGGGAVGGAEQLWPKKIQRVHKFLQLRHLDDLVQVNCLRIQSLLDFHFLTHLPQFSFDEYFGKEKLSKGHHENKKSTLHKIKSTVTWESQN